MAIGASWAAGSWTSSSWVTGSWADLGTGTPTEFPQAFRLIGGISVSIRL